MSINPREIPTGAVRFNTDSSKMEVYIGSTWMEVAVSSPNLGDTQSSAGGRGIIFGGRDPNMSDTIDYVTISSAGNAIDFGNMTNTRRSYSAMADSTRGLAAGGIYNSSGNKTNQIDFEIKKDLYDNIKLIGKDDDNLKKDLIEKKMSIDLFKIKNNSFNTINKDVPSLFKIPIKLPLNSPAGDYFVSMSLMDGGDTFETRKIKLEVKKPGIGSFVFSFAHKFSFVYGVFSAIIAVALGVFASLVFRKR